MPSRNIGAGQYMLIRADRYNRRADSDKVVFLHKVRNGQVSYPIVTRTEGRFYFEIRTGNFSVDVVQNGFSSFPGANTENFSGNAPDLTTISSNDYGRSVARDGALSDTDAASDWTSVAVSTPGGPNDVTNSADADGDGIPDANEVSGSTFAGLPLYDWGARTSVRDIFIHIDYMQSENLGIKPQRGALDLVVATFSNKGIKVHFDVGDLFHSSSGIDPSAYDLSDTNHQVPF